MKKRRIPFVMRTLSKLSKEMNFKYHINKQRDDFGYLEFENKVRHYVHRFDIRVNQLGPHEIAGNKYYTDKFLKKFKYPIVPSELFFSEAYRAEYDIEGKGLEDALVYAETLVYPVIVKPNNGLKGNHVHKVFDKSQLRKTLLKVFKFYDKVLVQKFAKGSDYRIIIYQGSFISAYRRIPLTVIGDGRRSILEMLQEQQLQAVKEDRSLSFDMPLIKSVLKRRKKRLSFVPKRGEEVVLLDNANLSTGGYAEDISHEIHPQYIKQAISAAKDMHLRLSGIDLMVEGDIRMPPKKGSWKFLEINASPGFDWYSRLGKEQEKKILDLFRRILLDIKNGDISV